eukprot:482331-Amphidinium_carterae.1
MSNIHGGITWLVHTMLFITPVRTEDAREVYLERNKAKQKASMHERSLSLDHIGMHKRSLSLDPKRNDRRTMMLEVLRFQSA